MPSHLIMTYAMLPRGGSGVPALPQVDEEEDSCEEELYTGPPDDAVAEEATA
jgi:hypothetical protein